MAPLIASSAISISYLPAIDAGAGHPGGMLPLTQAEAETLHSPLLPDNLYVCDATILPQTLGLPPMLTIMALAKRIAKIITDR